MAASVACSANELIMRDRGSHNPTGSFADLTAKPLNRVKGKCETCGAGLPTKQKRFCGACYDVRLQANIAANRHKYKKPR